MLTRGRGSSLESNQELVIICFSMTPHWPPFLTEPSRDHKRQKPCGDCMSFLCTVESGKALIEVDPHIPKARQTVTQEERHIPIQLKSSLQRQGNSFETEKHNFTNVETMSYKYHSLVGSPDPSIIRLIRLKPGGFESSLQCELLTASLDQKPHFDALSYCWGSEKKSRKLLCSSDQFPITENLSQALRKLRQETEV